MTKQIFKLNKITISIEIAILIIGIFIFLNPLINPPIIACDCGSPPCDCPQPPASITTLGPILIILPILHFIISLIITLKDKK